jgi:hypothetical protein
MSYLQKKYLWIWARFERYWIGSRQGLCIKSAAFSAWPGCYRRFIPNFSKISKPIFDLLKKEEKIVWNAERDEAFQTLNKLLTTSPVLAQSDIAKTFDDYYDASGTGLGCVLMQEAHVIAYSSRQLRRMKSTIPLMILSWPLWFISCKPSDIIFLGMRLISSPTASLTPSG